MQTKLSNLVNNSRGPQSRRGTRFICRQEGRFKPWQQMPGRFRRSILITRHQTDLLQLAAFSFRTIKYWSGFAGDCWSRQRHPSRRRRAPAIYSVSLLSRLRSALGKVTVFCVRQLFARSSLRLSTAKAFRKLVGRRRGTCVLGGGGLE
jgi:hypothetical protein